MGDTTKDGSGVPLYYTKTGVPNTGGNTFATGRARYCTVPIGSVAYGSFGTSAVHVAGTIYIADVVIPQNTLVTGISVLNGATAATDKLIAILFPAGGGVPVVTSALTGILAAGPNTFQNLAFTAPVTVIGPARYWVGIQCNGTTATTRRVAASTFVDVMTKSYTGAFGTIGALTVPTTFTADVGPIAYVY
jgi:hypothetical protein